ncbi:MAG: S41 family peptidase [Patescibacteria group bacterium]
MTKTDWRTRFAFLLLATIFLISAPFGCTNPEPRITDPPPIAVDDLDPQDTTQEVQLLAHITYELDALYYDPLSLDHEKLYNAALAGVQAEFKKHGVDWKYEKIEGVATRYGANQRFLREYSKAKALKAKSVGIGERDLILAAADNMLESLNRSHTYFIYPKWHPLRVSGYDRDKFVGIGVVIETLDDSMVFLSRVCKRSPADRAGLQMNDQLLAIDDVPVTADLNQLSGKIRGDLGTKVKITVQRGQEKKDFLVDRGYISPEYGNGWIEKDGAFQWGILELAGFNDTSMSAVDSSIRELGLFRGKVDGLIIDLRGNPGGQLALVKDLLEWFLPIHTEIYCTESKKEGKTSFITGELPKFNDPIIILIDGNSASGSEIFSAIMKETGRAALVGKKSAGAIEVGNKVDRIGFDAEAVITVQQIYTAEGKNFEGVGVTPDHLVERTKEDVLAGRDPYLDKAKELLRKRCGGK